MMIKFQLLGIFYVFIMLRQFDFFWDQLIIIGDLLKILLRQFYFLNQLLCKDYKFVWIDSCEQVFKVLKDVLISVFIFVFLDFKEKFYLYIDVFNEGLGVILG